MKRVTLYEAAYAILRLPDLLDYQEPIGALTAPALRKLNSCIDAPFAHYGRAYKYWFIHQRAAAMFYFLIKNHPLENGNKRSAVAITMTFWVKNGKWLDVTPDSLYQRACKVAESQAGDSEAIIKALCSVFKDHTQNF